MSNKTVKVVATQTGFYCGLREEGDVFEIPESLVSDNSWFKPVDLVASDTSTGSNSNYSRMNKEQLLETANLLGVEVSSDLTKAQIIELLSAEGTQE